MQHLIVIVWLTRLWRARTSPLLGVDPECVLVEVLMISWSSNDRPSTGSTLSALNWSRDHLRTRFQACKSCCKVSRSNSEGKLAEDDRLQHFRGSREGWRKRAFPSDNRSRGAQLHFNPDDPVLMAVTGKARPPVGTIGLRTGYQSSDSSVPFTPIK